MLMKLYWFVLTAFNTTLVAYDVAHGFYGVATFSGLVAIFCAAMFIIALSKGMGCSTGATGATGATGPAGPAGPAGECQCACKAKKAKTTKSILLG